MRYVLPALLLLSASPSPAQIQCTAYPLAIINLDSGAAHSLQRELSALRSAINEEIRVASAESLDQCALLPLGERPCGGPSEYLVYSREVSDAQKLAALAQSYTARQSEWNRFNQIAGTRELLLPPKLLLSNGTCRAE